MPKLIDWSKVKSLKQINTKQLQDVIRRYELGSACGTTSKGEVFLQQQSVTAKVMPTTLTKVQIREACEKRGITWNEMYAERVKHYIASDESVDSYGDIIKQDGWDFNSRFSTNPAIMWCHDYEQMNIGSGIFYNVQNSELHMDVLFALKEIYPFADMVFRMVDAGMCKGNSVGFIPKKVMQVDDEDERKELGLGRWGVVFLEQMLLEDTICPIGANSNALVQDALVNSVRKGILKQDELVGLMADTTKETSAPDIIKQTIDRALVLLSNKTLSIPVPEERGCIPFKAHSMDAEDAAWDGPVEIAAATVEDLKVMCSWFDSEKPNVKTSYKLPHHRANGYHTVWKGVASAMGALLGARGGANIPEGDRKGIYSHLKKHYTEFGKDAPEFKEYTAEELEKIFPASSGPKVTCSHCKKEFDYAAQPEVAMGAVACPHCKSVVDQTGVSKEDPALAKIAASLKALESLKVIDNINAQITGINTKITSIENDIAFIKSVKEDSQPNAGDGGASQVPETKHYFAGLLDKATEISKQINII